MILVYVDGVLHMSHDTVLSMLMLGKSYRLKANKFGEPDCYLGTNIEKVCVGQTILFSMQCDDYVKSSITSVEKMLEDNGDDSGNL